MRFVLEGKLGTLVHQACVEAAPASEVLSSGLDCRMAYLLEGVQVERFGNELTKLFDQTLDASDRHELHRLVMDAQGCTSVLLMAAKDGVAAEVLGFSRPTKFKDLQLYCRLIASVRKDCSDELDQLRQSADSATVVA